MLYLCAQARGHKLLLDYPSLTPDPLYTEEVMGLSVQSANSEQWKHGESPRCVVSLLLSRS